MASLLQHAFSFVLTLAGGSMLTYLAKAFSIASNEWGQVPMAINMSMAPLTLFGAGVMGAGPGILLHPNPPEKRR